MCSTHTLSCHSSNKSTKKEDGPLLSRGGYSTGLPQDINTFGFKCLVLAAVTLNTLDWWKYCNNYNNNNPAHPPVEFFDPRRPCAGISYFLIVNAAGEKADACTRWNNIDEPTP